MGKTYTLLIKVMLSLFIVMTGSKAWAEDATITINYNSTFSPNLPTASSSVNSTATAHTVEGLEIKEKGIYKGTSNSYLMFVQNKGYLYNTTSLGTIKSVAVTYSSGTSTTAKAGVYFGSSEMSTYTTTDNVQIKGQSKTDTWENSTNGNGFFQLSTSNKNCQITKIVITYDASGGSTAYSVTYDANGATSGTVPTDATSYTDESNTVTVLGNTGSLAKTGYSFGGWNTQADGNGTNYSADETFTITANTTLYAKWNAKTLSSISCTGTPTTTAYSDGQSFNPAGLTITATYDDNSTDDVTDLVTWTPDPLTIGTTSVTGTYNGKTCTVDGITVTAAPGSTADNPYTVAQAIAATPSSGTSSNVYIKGIVSSFHSNSNYITSDNYHRYYISDDGTTKGQLLVFNGKGLNNAPFSNATDLQIGDIVTIYGGLTTYSGTKEVAADNYITSLKRKNDSDLTITSSSTVELERTSATPFPTSTITWTTSSKGVMSFESDDESVATVTDAGVITAVGAGEATITIKQATDDDYKYGEKTVTVNVTDNRSVCATDISLTSSTTLTVGDMDDFSATSTKNADFTGSIAYTYETSDATILEEATGTYSANKVGNVTVTITATPTGGNADSFKPASQDVEVTVNGTNSISLDPTSKTVAFSSSTFDIAATVPTDNYNGTVSAVSSNEAVATVSVNGTTLTVTPVAVGSATITVTAGTDTYYPSTAQEVCTVEFTQPVGGTTAYVPVETLFSETFSECNGTGEEGSFSGTGNDAIKSDNTGWNFTKANAANGCGKFGSGSNAGSARTPSISVNSGSTYSLTFKAAPWSSESTNMNVSVTGGTISGISDANMTTNSWNEYSATITATSSSMTITFSASNNRFFLDDVVVTKAGSPISVTLNNSGYATYCSEYPLDFSEATDYSAWYVTGVSGENISFAKITGGIKGGEGILLKGTPNATISLTSKASDNSLGNDNWFVGTLAPTYIENVGEAYGLSGNTFVKNNAPGAIKANRAYIPASKLPSEVKSLNFIFDDISTGINSIETMPMDGRIFNLQGQEVKNPVRGIYIVNGKKVLIK